MLVKLYSYLKELGSLTPMAFLMAILPVIGSSILLLQAYPLGSWLRGNWEIGTPLYLFGILIFCGLALLPTNVVGILAGWSFGLELGIAVLSAGIVGAACISFVVHSRIARDKLPHVLDAHPHAKAVYGALLGQGVWRAALIISLVRLSPVMPFALTNFLMAAAQVPLTSFLAGTFLGMLPRSSAVVFVGAGLSDLSFDGPQDTWLVVFGIAATIIAVVIISIISKHALQRLTAEQN